MEKVKLGEICFIEKGKIGIQAATPGKYPLVTTALERGSHSEYHFEGEAVCIPLVSATGHGHASIKRIHFEKGKFAVGNILCACIPKDYNKTSAKFLHLYLSLLKDFILVPLMQGSANVSLKIKDLEKVEVPNISFERQLEIVEEFERLEIINRKLLLELDQQQTYLQFLRQSILHEAVQGKLTKQNPTDEPATELLKRIQLDKKKLAKKLKEERKSSYLGQSVLPFDLPEGWITCRLGEICYLITDGTHHTPKYIEEGIPFISVKNLTKGELDFTDTKFISVEEHNELIKRCKPEFGDILLTKVGTTGIAKVIDDGRPFSIFVSVALLKFNKELIFNQFLELLINSPLVKKQSAEGTEGVGNKNLVLKKIQNFLIPLPPLHEQKRIVSRVQQLQKQLSQLDVEVQQSRVYAQQLLQTVLKEAFEGKEEVRTKTFDLVAESD